LEFVEYFNIENRFEIEPIYTGKMFFALHHMISNKILDPVQKIMAVHTGGLQYLSSE
jgi:1-aminocyclopropane-1-carboxylate deaminase